MSCAPNITQKCTLPCLEPPIWGTKEKGMGISKNQHVSNDCDPRISSLFYFSESSFPNPYLLSRFHPPSFSKEAYDKHFNHHSQVIPEWIRKDLPSCLQEIPTGRLNPAFPCDTRINCSCQERKATAITKGKS